MKNREIDARSEIKCPKCGGPANKMFLLKVKGNKAHFLVECWSGDCYHEGEEYHYFKQTVNLSSRKKVKKCL